MNAHEQPSPNGHLTVRVLHGGPEPPNPPPPPDPEPEPKPEDDEPKAD